MFGIDSIWTKILIITAFLYLGKPFAMLVQKGYTYLMYNVSQRKLNCLFRATSWTIVSFTPTLLVNKKLWSYHKVVLDLWRAGIWLKVSIFYQFHEAKSRCLSSEPVTGKNKRVISIFMKLVKRLCFCPDFCFLWIKCYFVITPIYFRMFTFWNVKSR